MVTEDSKKQPRPARSIARTSTQAGTIAASTGAGRSGTTSLQLGEWISLTPSQALAARTPGSRHHARGRISLAFLLAVTAASLVLSTSALSRSVHRPAGVHTRTLRGPAASLPRRARGLAIGKLRSDQRKPQPEAVYTS